MATYAQPSINLAQVLARRGYLGEANALRKQEAAQRAAATTILDPLDVAGEYDAGRLLKTTLGGQIRPITLDDLRNFSALATKLGKRFKGGITAQGVIDASLQVDRNRANREIRTAVVVRAQSGALHFVTNAGPHSEATRHHVHVDFPAFKAFAASPQDPKKLAPAMIKGPLRFDCDCGRHRYWYRFIATKGGFAALRPETGYPKIRNPKLVGVACKHALRVMLAVLNDANVRTKVVAMIAAAQKNDVTAQVTKATDARAEAQKQLSQAHYLRNQAETRGQRTDRLSKTQGAQARAVAAAMREAARRAQAEAASSRKSLREAMDRLQKAPLTKAMRDALIAQLQAANTID